MQLVLQATGLHTEIDLFRVEVDGDGVWSYQSQAVQFAQGHLTEADRAQLNSFFEKVNWELELLNSPMSPDDRRLFRLTVRLPDQGERTYQFSEAMNHRSWQFIDLVHFLRHNVATGGDPVGRQELGPTTQPYDQV
jgi:hypothetical protein